MGEKIRYFRLKKEICQKELARELKVTKACVCRYEKNVTKPDEKTLNMIEKILKTAIGKLTENV
ncbi:MAG: helix-turn-helix transcriptional regulator [Candidatus Aureabacteria bacterium]|nr:helix-turn-helix transcriptional regulator [Candidatus Auribacterota bacterium]